MWDTRIYRDICWRCKQTGKCIFYDLVRETAPKLAEADGIIAETPVYYGNPNGAVMSFMQCLFYSRRWDLHMKIGTLVVSCRRGGNSAVFETVNQFFGINGLPVVPSICWNDVHGFKARDVLADTEGTETIRNMTVSMVFMMHSIRTVAEQF